jgi:hypothetical protein
MNKYFYIIVLFTIIIFGCHQPTEDNIKTENNIPTYFISGIVSLSDPSIDVSETTVKLNYYNSQEPVITKPHSDGLYIFNDIPDGMYNIEFTLYGYEKGTINAFAVNKENVVNKNILLKKSYNYSDYFLTNDADIYVIGRAKENNISKAAYWINGIKYVLEGGENGYANGLKIWNNDAYIVGSYYDPSSTYVYDQMACYWLNGVKYNLQCSTGGEASAVYIYNSSVYIAGSYNNGSKYIPCYWKNDIKYDLPIDGNDSYNRTSGIIVDNNDVYISGYCGTYNTGYWKNGIWTELPNGYFTNGISVFNNKVYTVGSYIPTPGYTGACYWENQNQVTLPGGGHANSIFIYNNEVYISGFKSNDYKTCYWVDGLRTDLNSGYVDSGYGIFVLDNIIYIAGSYREGSVSYPCFFVGEKEFHLSDGIDHAMGIVVNKK